MYVLWSLDCFWNLDYGNSNNGIFPLDIRTAYLAVLKSRVILLFDAFRQRI